MAGHSDGSSGNVLVGFSNSERQVLLLGMVLFALKPFSAAKNLERRVDCLPAAKEVSSTLFSPFPPTIPARHRPVDSPLICGTRTVRGSAVDATGRRVVLYCFLPFYKLAFFRSIQGWPGLHLDTAFSRRRSDRLRDSSRALVASAIGEGHSADYCQIHLTYLQQI